jgi:hypothetical protein
MWSRVRLVKATVRKRTAPTRAWSMACDETSMATLAAPSALRLGERTLHGDRVAGGECARHQRARAAGADGAHERGRPARGLERLRHQEGAGGLAVGAG